MANQVASRLGGDDYQHLFTWLQVLTLKMPRENVRIVTVEDEHAGSFDDVTVKHEEGVNEPDWFFQVKYHIDQRSEYSVAKLMEREGNRSSLLQKFFRTWRMLREANSAKTFRLNLISNWAWAENDPLRPYVEGHENGIKPEFFTAEARTKEGRAREELRQHLDTSEGEFRDFMLSLRLTLGYNCGQELAKRVSERMSWLGLKHDDAALKISAGIVREWIRGARQEINRDILDSVLASNGLVLQEGSYEKCVVVYLSSIKDSRFDVPPDFEVNWREYFDGPRFVKGHSLKAGQSWNDDLLPELYEVEESVRKATGCKLVRARGFARLSPWFAFGHVFSDVSGYTLEVDQNGRFWRTDAAASENFQMITTNGDGEVLGDGRSDVIAVGLSVTGDIEPRLREYLSTEQSIGKLHLIQPNRELGRECLDSAGDVVALARQSKTLLRNFIASSKARKVYLFYFGPLSGACFLGHSINAMGADIQIMEDQSPGYAPSFLLG